RAVRRRFSFAPRRAPRSTCCSSFPANANRGRSRSSAGLCRRSSAGFIPRVRWFDRNGAASCMEASSAFRSQTMSRLSRCLTCTRSSLSRNVIGVHFSPRFPRLEARNWILTLVVHNALVDIRDFPFHPDRAEYVCTDSIRTAGEYCERVVMRERSVLDGSAEAVSDLRQHLVCGTSWHHRPSRKGAYG